MLDTPLDRKNDLILHNPEGRVEVLWFVDFTDDHARRVRDILFRSAERIGDENSVLAVRLVSKNDRGGRVDIAARAAAAAHWQGQYRRIHRALFDHTGEFSSQTVLKIAEELRLDIPQFQDDLYSDRTESLLAAHQLSFEASNSGQTPAFFIDNAAYDGAWDESSIIDAITKPLGVRLHLASSDFFNWAASAGLVLVLATCAALLLVNVGFSEWHHTLLTTSVGVSVGAWEFFLSFEDWVNEGLMSLFFLLVGIEVKREIVDGELSSFDQAILPIAGALGGMVVPALLYVSFTWNSDAVGGWGVPMATDIAFTLGILALLGDRIPVSLKVFISALAIADDIGAILVIALFYGHGFHFDQLVFVGIVLTIMAGLNFGRVYARTPYVILGVALWYFVLQSGLHATLAGVLTALFIPSRSAASIEGVALRTRDLFRSEIKSEKSEISSGTYQRLQGVLDRLKDPGFHLQNALENWSSYLILPLFAFLNTGILLVGSNLALLSPEVLGVVVGLVVGKPLGICLAVWLVIQSGRARLSSEITWFQLIGSATLCGLGFTMSIFIASAAFEGDQLASVKVAVLIASTLAAVLGSVLLLQTPRQAQEAATA